tara:strand:+ start:7247 stop:8152 length:906 start_codon:yes stop_codon:yes gene_type:complete
MKRSETKLLVENWRKFVSDPAEFEKKNNDVLSSNILIENIDRNTYFDGSFGSALNEVKLGRMSAEVLLEQVVSDFQSQMILNESVWNTIKDFAQTGAKKITSAVKSAFEKIDKMYEKIVLQAWNIITKSTLTFKTASSVIKKLSKTILSKISDFKEAHPVLFSVMIAVLFVLTLVAIMILTSKEASAKITDASPFNLKVAKGLMLQNQYEYISKSTNVEDHQKIHTIIKQFNQAIESKEAYKVSDLHSYTQKAIKIANETILEAKKEGSDSNAYKHLQQLLDYVKKEALHRVQGTGIQGVE